MLNFLINDVQKNMELMQQSAKVINIDTKKTPIPLSVHVKETVEHYFDQLNGHDTSGLYAMVISEVEKPLIQGRDLIELFDLEPGPMFGRILTRVQIAYEEGAVRTKEEALKFVREKILKGLDIKKEGNNMYQKEVK